MNTLIESTYAELDNLLALTPRLVLALGVLLAFYLVGRVAGHGLGRVLRRTRAPQRHERVARRVVALSVAMFGVTTSLHVLGLTALATSLLATGGFMAIVLGFAFREIGENLLAGVFLSFDRSFDVDDLIETGGLRGTVKEVALRSVQIRTADGCDIFIPSATFFRTPLFNFTRDGLRRGEFAIGIDYANDPARAREILLRTVTESGMTLATPESTVEVTQFTPQYVELTAYFWTDTFSAEISLPHLRSVLMERGRLALREAGFTFSPDVTTSVAVGELAVRLARAG